MIDDRTDDGVPVDVVLRVLSNEDRRAILEHLLRRDDPVSVEELVDLVVAESRPTDGARPSASSSQVTRRLHHNHLPMIRDAGLAEYDRDRGLVEATDAARVVEPYLELLRSDDSG